MATKKSSKTSLRNPLAALAATHDHMAKSEPNALNRMDHKRAAKKARELARAQPKPKG
ncbi:hypothetical protein [Nitrococcus mobilis]|uniref:hypothetical protein n=1 Tax=Nitrococcus mobilis TaxID=35797 RepID=UPI0002EFFD4A|nr:hypothetical protein [Nitrococcus mobilis]